MEVCEMREDGECECRRERGIEHAGVECELCQHRTHVLKHDDVGGTHVGGNVECCECWHGRVRLSTHVEMRCT